jgi:hypothetical protein
MQNIIFFKAAPWLGGTLPRIGWPERNLAGNAIGFPGQIPGLLRPGRHVQDYRQ